MHTWNFIGSFMAIAFSQLSIAVFKQCRTPSDMKKLSSYEAIKKPKRD